jgi:hypothetical protein
MKAIVASSLRAPTIGAQSHTDSRWNANWRRDRLLFHTCCGAPADSLHIKMNAREQTMNRSHSQHTHPLAPRRAHLPHKDTIEWEEMPSLAPRMKPMDMRPAASKPMPRTEAMEFNSAWGVTMPAHLDASPEPTPFRETIRGLVTREMDEPELFKHFFG